MSGFSSLAVVCVVGLCLVAPSTAKPRSQASRDGVVLSMKCSNGKYATVTSGSVLSCSSSKSEDFWVNMPSAGKISMQTSDGMFCSSSKKNVHCDKSSQSAEELFDEVLHQNGDNHCSLRCSNGKFLTSAKKGKLACIGDEIDDAESFEITVSRW